MYIPSILPLLTGLPQLLFNTPSTQFPGHQLYKLRDGNLIPSPFFGVGSVLKGTNVTETVAMALNNGYRAIDNAAYYRTEKTAGAAIAASGIPRENLYLTSKFDALHGKDDVRAEVMASLEELGTTYLDLYLIHSPFFVSNTSYVWGEMEKLVDEGIVRSIGVSNYDTEHLEEILSFARIKPAVNQIKYHAYNAKAAEPMLSLCEKHSILIEAYSSLTPLTAAPGGPSDSVLARVSQRLSKAWGSQVTPAQAIFAWLRTKSIIVVTTSSSEDRQRQQLVAFEKDFPLWEEKEITEYENFGGWNGTA